MVFTGNPQRPSSFLQDSVQILVWLVSGMEAGYSYYFTLIHDRKQGGVAIVRQCAKLLPEGPSWSAFSPSPFAQ